MLADTEEEAIDLLGKVMLRNWKEIEKMCRKEKGNSFPTGTRPVEEFIEELKNKRCWYTIKEDVESIKNEAIEGFKKMKSNKRQEQRSMNKDTEIELEIKNYDFVERIRSKYSWRSMMKNTMFDG